MIGEKSYAISIAELLEFILERLNIQGYTKANNFSSKTKIKSLYFYVINLW